MDLYSRSGGICRNSPAHDERQPGAPGPDDSDECIAGKNSDADVVADSPHLQRKLAGSHSDVPGSASDPESPEGLWHSPDPGRAFRRAFLPGAETLVFQGAARCVPALAGTGRIQFPQRPQPDRLSGLGHFDPASALLLRHRRRRAAFVQKRRGRRSLHSFGKASQGRVRHTLSIYRADGLFPDLRGRPLAQRRAGELVSGSADFGDAQKDHLEAGCFR
jgi:hypothetical protein